MLESIVIFVNKYLLGAIIAAIGGAAHVLYRASKGETLSMLQATSAIVLSAYVGFIIGEMIPRDWPFYSSYISISGFCAGTILLILEKKGADMVMSILNSKK